MWETFVKQIYSLFLGGKWYNQLKTVENGRAYAINHRNYLVELSPDNDILADQV